MLKTCVDIVFSVDKYFEATKISDFFSTFSLSFHFNFSVKWLFPVYFSTTEYNSKTKVVQKYIFSIFQIIYQSIFSSQRKIDTQ